MKPTTNGSNVILIFNINLKDEKATDFTEYVTKLILNINTSTNNHIQPGMTKQLTKSPSGTFECELSHGLYTLDIHAIIEYKMSYKNQILFKNSPITTTTINLDS